MLAKPKERKSDRILVLKPIEGKKTTSTTGHVDPRLFTRENNLHAVLDPRGCTWFLKYDSGGLPEPLKQRFTNFTKLLECVKIYFAKRNVEIKEIID